MKEIINKIKDLSLDLTLKYPKLHDWAIKRYPNFKNVLNEYTLRLTRKEIDAYIQSLNDKTEIDNVNVLMKTAYSTAAATPYDGRGIRDFMLKVNARMASSLYRNLHRVVGFQPMNHCLNQVFFLSYSRNAEDRNVVEIKAQAIEAGSAKYAATINVSEMGRLAATALTNATVGEFVREAVSEVVSELVRDMARVKTEEQINQRLSEYTQGKLVDEDELRAVSKDMTNAVCISSAMTAMKTKRGHANVVIVNNKNLIALKASPRFDEYFMANAPDVLIPVGLIDSCIKVYLFEDVGEKIVTCYKGDNGTDCGLIYAPFWPISIVGTFVNPLTYEPYTSFFTRYGKAVVADSPVSTFKDYFNTLTFVPEPVKPAKKPRKRAAKKTVIKKEAE
jgi:hypothetical protein